MTISRSSQLSETQRNIGVAAVLARTKNSFGFDKEVLPAVYARFLHSWLAGSLCKKVILSVLFQLFCTSPPSDCANNCHLSAAGEKMPEVASVPFM